MAKSKTRDKSGKEPIPQKFQDLKEVSDFWDTHSAADYWDESLPADVEFNLDDTPRYVALAACRTFL